MHFHFSIQAMRFPPKSYNKDLESAEVSVLSCYIFLLQLPVSLQFNVIDLYQPTYFYAAKIKSTCPFPYVCECVFVCVCACVCACVCVSACTCALSMHVLYTRKAIKLGNKWNENVVHTSLVHCCDCITLLNVSGGHRAQKDSQLLDWPVARWIMLRHAQCSILRRKDMNWRRRS